MNKPHIKIGERLISEEAPVFIIAELSCNHLQNFDLAVKTIHEIKETGADAVKFQTFKPESITIDCDKEYFQINRDTLWDGRTLFDLYKEVYTPWEWIPKLTKIADELGLISFSSPFDKQAVDFLEDLNVSAYKVASFEIQDIPLIRYIASKKKPIILSTGIATLSDIELAVDTCREEGNEQIALLKCSSAYPAPLEEINLKTIQHLKDTFNVITGFSDHTLGISAPVASVALGAKIIEKHFISDRSLGGPDAEFSLEPLEFKSMVDSVRDTEKAIGKVNYTLSERIIKNKIFSRSLFVVEDIKKGEIFNESNLRSIRPGNGLHPKYLTQILGKPALSNIEKGTPMSWDYVG